MDTTPTPLTAELDADNKRHCIRIKARIKIQGDQEEFVPVVEVKPPYQAYCETISSSRPQSPDVFTTPPTHSEPFKPVQSSRTATYTARITTRKTNGLSVSTSTSRETYPQQIAPSIKSSIAAGTDRDHETPAQRTSLHGYALSTNRYRTVSLNPTPRGSQSGHGSGTMSRNRTPSLSQAHQANGSLRPPSQSITTRTPLRQKRYGRMNYHPLPPLPPSPPDTPVSAPSIHQSLGNTTVNFSRGEIKRKSVQQQVYNKVLPHQPCADSHVTPPVHPDASLAEATAGHERPQSKASRRTVTFADDTTISSRSSSPDHHSRVYDRTLRQSKSFSSEPQTRSSLRLCRSYDSLLAAGIAPENDARIQASRRTAPKDFQHRYAFGQRPVSRVVPPPNLGRTCNPNYNPRLSTSKAQYRGLATLPRPPRSSLRVSETQTGPRQPPWGSLDNLEERRERRVDAREREQVKQFRAATLSEATTLGSTDSFGRDKLKKEVEEYKEQVMSVYPDLTFDGNAGKEGRRCCCAVM